MDRALRFGRRGWGFDSLQAHKFEFKKLRWYTPKLMVPKCEANITTEVSQARDVVITKILCQRCDLYGGGFTNKGTDERAIEAANVLIASFRQSCPMFMEQEYPVRKRPQRS